MNDHIHEFVCEDCDVPVTWYGHFDGEPRCRACRYIKEHPDMPVHIKAILLGDESHE